jgi:endonuclease/exonuclease/phosphatase family metal-dependent hydrolase
MDCKAEPSFPSLSIAAYTRPWHSRFVTAVLFALLLASSAAAPLWPQALPKGQGDLRVMTYNVYEGADLTTAFTAKDQTHFVAAISAILADVRATNPPVRAEAIARQIGKARPTLISLQEVTQWSTCPTADYESCSGPQTVLYDLLDLIKDALQARGLHYKEVGRVTVNELNAPAMTGAGRVIVFYTQRSAILARADINAHELQLSNAQSARFNTTHTVPIAGGGTYVIHRAWISVDVKFHKTSFRFIDTQLEAFDPGTNYNQAQELISGPAHTSLPVVIAMDSNSKADPPANDFTPTYTNFLKSGFKDAWTETHGDAPGLTSGQDPTLLNPVSKVTQRIDLILLHGDLHARAVELFGGQQSDRNSGLWPSDHLAVAATLETH